MLVYCVNDGDSERGGLLTARLSETQGRRDSARRAFKPSTTVRSPRGSWRTLLGVQIYRSCPKCQGLHDRQTSNTTQEKKERASMMDHMRGTQIMCRTTTPETGGGEGASSYINTTTCVHEDFVNWRRAVPSSLRMGNKPPSCEHVHQYNTQQRNSEWRRKTSHPPAPLSCPPPPPSPHEPTSQIRGGGSPSPPQHVVTRTPPPPSKKPVAPPDTSPVGQPASSSTSSRTHRSW